MPKNSAWSCGRIFWTNKAGERAAARHFSSARAGKTLDSLFTKNASSIIMKPTGDEKDGPAGTASQRAGASCKPGRRCAAGSLWSPRLKNRRFIRDIGCISGRFFSPTWVVPRIQDPSQRLGRIFFWRPLPDAAGGFFRPVPAIKARAGSPFFPSPPEAENDPSRRIEYVQKGIHGYEFRRP